MHLQELTQHIHIDQCNALSQKNAKPESSTTEKKLFSSFQEIVAKMDHLNARNVTNAWNFHKTSGINEKRCKQSTDGNE